MRILFNHPITIRDIPPLRHARNGRIYTRFEGVLSQGLRTVRVSCTAWDETAQYLTSSVRPGQVVLVTGMINDRNHVRVEAAQSLKFEDDELGRMHG